MKEMIKLILWLAELIFLLGIAFVAVDGQLIGSQLDSGVRLLLSLCFFTHVRVLIIAVSLQGKRDPLGNQD
jgi:hypothetical protein